LRTHDLHATKLGERGRERFETASMAFYVIDSDQEPLLNNRLSALMFSQEAHNRPHVVFVRCHWDSSLLGCARLKVFKSSFGAFCKGEIRRRGIA
jgi:hypothetical protein